MTANGKKVPFEGETEDIADLIRRCMNVIENTLCDHYPDNDIISEVCDQQRQRAVEGLPNINYHHQREALRTGGEAYTTLDEIERHQRETIARLQTEKTALAVKIKEQEATIAHMRDTYWALSRRLKYFANRFCGDMSFAGAIHFIISESNSDWLLNRRNDDDPSDSEIPF